jgi:hypothetical protein
MACDCRPRGDSSGEVGAKLAVFDEPDKSISTFISTVVLG